MAITSFYRSLFHTIDHPTPSGQQQQTNQLFALKEVFM